MKLEIEIRMYWVSKTEKKWWEFWKPKEKRVLTDYNSMEEAANALAETEDKT